MTFFSDCWSATDDYFIWFGWLEIGEFIIICDDCEWVGDKYTQDLSLEDCKNACVSTPECRSLEFRHTAGVLETGECQMLKIDMASNPQFTYGPTSYYYIEKVNC